MEENERPIRIIDSRNKQYFVVDDAYLNGFARHLGPIASMVYISLCRHVNKNQYAFPSQGTIGNEIGASVRSVKEAIKKLKLWNIIDIKRERTNHRWEKNSYYLLDKSVWQKPSGAGNALDRSGANDDTDQGQEVHTKDTHIKEDISKDISVASQREQIPYRDVLAASTKVVGRSKNKSKPEINYLVEYLQTTMKLDKLDGSEVNNRRACSNLIRKFSPLQVKEMIDNASQSPFWSDKVRNFQTLFNNATKILDEKPKKESTLQVLEKFKPYEKS